MSNVLEILQMNLFSKTSMNSKKKIRNEITAMHGVGIEPLASVIVSF